MGRTTTAPRLTTPCVLLVSLLASFLTALPPAPAQAGKRVPRCFGERATIVGNNRPNRIVGTPGRDVIVGRGGDDLIIGRGGNDLICGGSGNDRLFGGPGNDKLSGGKGSDFLAGAGGDDHIIGGKGRRDFVQYLGGPRGVRVNLSKGTASGWGRDRLVGVEYASGTNHDDVLIGDDRRNLLFGQDGDDRLEGRGGNDFLFAGRGNDELDGGGGFDAADYTLSDDGVTVNLATGTATGEGADKLEGIEDVWGSTHADVLIGDSGPNQIFGWDGPDTLRGAGGDDLLVPGSGVDDVDGGSGADWIDFFFGKLSNFVATEPVNVDLDAGVATGQGRDTIDGIENISGTNLSDVLSGDNEANAIFGYNGDDELYGRAGNDWLDGGPGNDFLHGGSGSDWCTTGESFEDCESSLPPPVELLTDIERERRSRAALTDWVRISASR